MTTLDLAISIKSDKEFNKFLSRDDLHLIRELSISNVWSHNFHFLSKCHGLTTLSLSYIQCRKNIELYANNLQELHIDRMSIDNLNFLQNCHQLKKLHISYLKNIKFIPELPSSLIYLSIDGLPIDNVDFLKLAGNLESLSLCRLLINDLTCMAYCSKLQEVSFGFLNNIIAINYIPESVSSVTLYALINLQYIVKSQAINEFEHVPKLVNCYSG